MEMSVQRNGLARLENVCEILTLSSSTSYGRSGGFPSVWHAVCYVRKSAVAAAGHDERRAKDWLPWLRSECKPSVLHVR